ncbi:MAG TPA: hypothetical protein VM753_11195 [Anaeromyxobacter sp.]|nr:hypothetical protein [Anaeromyxobacter sp.]
MTESREAFFECSSKLEGELTTALVSAWDPEQAENMFREMLAAQGVSDPGEIVVTRLAADITRGIAADE